MIIYTLYYNSNKGGAVVKGIKKPTIKSIMEEVRKCSGHINANHRNIKSFNNKAREGEIVVEKVGNNYITFKISLPESLHYLLDPIVKPNFKKKNQWNNTK